MQREPSNAKTGVHLFHIKGQPYVLIYLRMVRGHKKYGIAYPALETTGTWEVCVAACELHYVQNNKSPRRVKCSGRNRGK